MAPDGRQAAIDAIQPIFEKQRDMRYEVKLAIDQGPYVMVHNWLQRWPGDRGAAVVDILRVEKGRIVEHWDVLNGPRKSPSTIIRCSSDPWRRLSRR